ncbi:alpha/beta hydrolase [Halorubrum ezzemoulense]|uniref:alpha/beta hydrolase n=1 Tax=Halorubrum ezzemoulense TaxID=337243 RepID=UPI00232B5622|nr:phospholipase [Halorubrum ezzemoulense]MDB2282925.1 phospholipase [Halorubrum ezzemoulense]MDB9252208.1 phospholipase [Halorubrum ezzemoulense]MDB9254842.1 phospholipase [Halorubrum ezzemoulense]MDB9275553.1 phospholipase [Halorubrum ezzemoulense]
MTEIPLEHVHVAPDEESGGEPAPAVFVLHGRGADEEDLLPVAAELPGDLHVVSLRAPDPLQGGYTWYELDLSAGGLESSQPDADDFRRSLDLIGESVERAVDAYGLDADRLGLLGFSQGAITSLSLLLEDPDRYAWVVALHGYLAESHADLDPDGIEGKPVFVGAGAGDRVIPESRTTAAVERFETLDADVASGSFPGGHGIGPQELDAVVEFVASRTA